MSFVISALQSYSNTIQQYDAQSSIQGNNEARLQAVKSLDMGVISDLGPSDSMVQSLSQSDKLKVMQNADNGLKQKCLEVWQDSLDQNMKKDIAEDFNVFAD